MHGGGIKVHAISHVVCSCALCRSACPYPWGVSLRTTRMPTCSNPDPYVWWRSRRGVLVVSAFDPSILNVDQHRPKEQFQQEQHRSLASWCTLASAEGQRVAMTNVLPPTSESWSNLKQRHQAPRSNVTPPYLTPLPFVHTPRCRRRRVIYGAEVGLPCRGGLSIACLIGVLRLRSHLLYRLVLFTGDCSREARTCQ